MTYSVQDVEAHIAEILRRVREGETIVLSEEGREVAEIRPLSDSQEEGLQELQERGVLGPPAKPEGTLSPITERPAALARFLESRPEGSFSPAMARPVSAGRSRGRTLQDPGQALPVIVLLDTRSGVAMRSVPRRTAGMQGIT